MKKDVQFFILINYIMGESWIDFVKRVQADGQKKDKDYSFKQAMSDASKRKSEWKRDGSSKKESHHDVSSSSSPHSEKKTKKGGRRRKGGTKKRRRTKSKSKSRSRSRK